MARLRPHAFEVKLVRQHAERVAQASRVKIEVAVRESARGQNINILLIADRHDDGSHDLSDFRPWAAFVQGFEPTPEGSAVLDLWVHTLGHEGELQTQLTAIFERRRLVRIEEHGRVLWTRKVG